MRDRPRIGLNAMHVVIVTLLLVAALAASLTMLLIQAGNMRVDATNAVAQSRAASQMPSSSPAPSTSEMSGTVESETSDEPSQSSSPSATPTASASESASSTPPERPADDGLVDINTADVAQLDAVNGIGPVIARRIVDYRNANGRFSSVDDLLDVPGIGMKTLDKMRGQLVVR